MVIITHIKEVANKRGITSALALSECTKLSYNTAHGLYNGSFKRVDIETLDKLCKTLEVQPGELFSWKPDPEENKNND